MAPLIIYAVLIALFALVARKLWNEDKRACLVTLLAVLGLHLLAFFCAILFKG